MDENREAKIQPTVPGEHVLKFATKMEAELWAMKNLGPEIESVTRSTYVDGVREAISQG